MRKMQEIEMIYMKTLILFSFFIFFLSSCDVREDDVVSFRTLVSDTSVTHRLTNEIDFSKQKCVDLNLPDIHDGVDSFELRIWVSDMTIPDRGTIIRYEDSKWLAQKYYYFENGDAVDSMQVYNIPIPKDIAEIVTYLNRAEVLQLPSQAAIPGFVDNMADGQTCTIEIATRNYYKGLDYHCPEHFDEPNNIKFMEIVDFLNSYFRFYHSWCSPKR